VIDVMIYRVIWKIWTISPWTEGHRTNFLDAQIDQEIGHPITSSPVHLLDHQLTTSPDHQISIYL
jgi:hypothetical protein